MQTKPSYNDGLQYLYTLEKYGVRLGLKMVKTLLKSLDNPQDKLSIIHIGGTNGKGSTSAMIASVMTKAGYKVGLYTSPHLARFNERIRINGREISDRKIAELVERIRCAIGDYPTSHIPHPISHPTFFEFTTAMAFLYFAEEKVDFAVMEVGLGGRLDATNVGSPLVSIITNISKDHEAMLGSRMEDITFEKAGIIKKGGILISGETKPAVLKVLAAECKNKKAMFYRLNRDFFVDDGSKEVRSSSPNVSIGDRKSSASCGVRRFTFRGRRWVLKDLETNLLGRHQQKNAACALAALEILEEARPRMFLSGKGFCIPESAVRDGLRDVFWPGRLEIVSKRPLVILDCAHNPAGAEVLKDVLENEFDYKKLFLVLGIMADKDIKGILSKLAPLASTVIFTRPKTERAASLDALCREIKPYMATSQESETRNLISGKRVMSIENVKDACRIVLSLCGKDDIICITGSVFTVGEAREFLLDTRMRKKRNEK